MLTAIDAFVNHFLGSVNYRYTAIYGPTLTDQYVHWWADRAAGRRLSPEFTCLLLRICAYSVQYLTPVLRSMIEFELACDSQVLTDRFATAAEQLSQSFEASATTIERVQEKFLKCAWLKSESKVVESWHALGCTIRLVNVYRVFVGHALTSNPYTLQGSTRTWYVPPSHYV
jgi:hypothetical protein